MILHQAKLRRQKKISVHLPGKEHEPDKGFRTLAEGSVLDKLMPLLPGATPVVSGKGRCSRVARREIESACAGTATRLADDEAMWDVGRGRPVGVQLLSDVRHRGLVWNRSQLRGRRRHRRARHGVPL
jgi:hypothetical protein